MDLTPFKRDLSEPYDASLNAYLCWQDAIAQIRADKIAKGEIKPETNSDLSVE